MRYIIIAMTAFLFFFTSDCTSQWVLSYTDTTMHFLNLQFSSSNTGWAAGYRIQGGSVTDGKIIKTSNSGINWTESYSGTGKGIWGIYFYNDYTGWAAGDKGLVLKTTNGGINWAETITSAADYHNNVFFLNQFTGWIAGTKLYKTTDSGNNWAAVNSPAGDLYSVYFLNENTGYTTAYYSKIYRTTNAGAEWVQVHAGQYHTFIYDLCFLNSGTGYGAGDSGYDGILKTSNGGLNWVKICSEDELMSVFFRDEITGFAGGRSNILMTTNSGINWTAEYLPGTNAGLTRKICRSDDSTYWAANEGGYIYKRRLTHVSINPTNAELPAEYSLEQNYPNPFNTATKISFQLSVASLSILKIFDITGNEVATIVNERLQAGKYEVRFDGTGLNSGVYFCRMSAGNFSKTIKIIILK